MIEANLGQCMLTFGLGSELGPWRTPPFLLMLCLCSSCTSPQNGGNDDNLISAMLRCRYGVHSTRHLSLALQEVSGICVRWYTHHICHCRGGVCSIPRPHGLHSQYITTLAVNALPPPLSSTFSLPTSLNLASTPTRVSVRLATLN